MTSADALLAMMQGWPKPVYVAIDGALLPDVPGVTRRADVFARSLFVEHRDPGTVLAGPWFAALDVRHLKSFLLIEGIETAAVFWGGAVEEAVVFRHLRSLNLFDIPRPADAPPDPFAADPETVLFRHWDPAMMALVLPVLEPAQRARLLGPMDVIGLHAPSLGGAREAKRRANWPAPEHGRIRLSVAQMEHITKAMIDGSRQKITAFLRDAAPLETAGIDEPALLIFVADCESNGRSLGLTTEQGLARWTYLMLVSKGAIATVEPVRAFMAKTPGTPDERVGALMLAIAHELDRRGVAA
jgi:hypothetical protein